LKITAFALLRAQKDIKKGRCPLLLQKLFEKHIKKNNKKIIYKQKENFRQYTYSANHIAA